MKMTDPDKKVEKVIDQQSDMVKAMSVESPIEVDPSYTYIEVLPSKYRMYPDGTKLYARPLKTAEVKALSTMNEKNANSIINNVIGSAVKGISIGQVLLADKLFLIFWLRANTYKNSEYKIEFTCPDKACGCKGEYSIHLDTLEVEDIKDSFSETVEKELPISKTTFSVRPLRIKDENEVELFIKKNEAIASRFRRDFLDIANCINTVDGIQKGLMSKYNFLTELDPYDYSYVESYLEHCDMGVKPKTEVTCESCGGSVPVAVTFRPDFFLPKHTF